LPALTYITDVLTWSNIIATCPPITSTSDCALPLYGTCSMRIPALRNEHLPGDVARRAVSGGGIAQMAGLRLGERDQLLHRARRHVRVNHQHLRDAADEADTGEVLRRVVAGALHDRGHARESDRTESSV